MNNDKHFLDPFFNPESVAVVGASRNMGTANFFLTANLVNLKYPGKVYPVNPNAKEIAGLKAYPSLKSIEDDIDLAVISVPAPKTPAIIRDCIEKGIKHVAIIAGGFSETGSTGKGLQEEVRSLIKESGIRVIGPNALSPINSALSFIIGFGPAQPLTRGGLSFIFQSGLYQPRLNYLLHDFHLHINKLIDLGNKMDINEVDALEYFTGDESTRVIALHMESIAGDGRKFIKVLKEATRKKPVIVLKSGRTEAGAKAASSHTGAIMKSSDMLIDAALKQAGAIRAGGLDEFFDLAKVFEYYPPLENNRIAIASFSGGEGVITTDFCQLHGLRLAQPNAQSKERLSKVFPAWDIPLNPFDTGVTGQFNPKVDVTDVFLDVLADDPDVDCLAIQTGGGPTGPVNIGTDSRARKLIEFYKSVISRGKLLVVWTVSPGRSDELTELLESNRIPVFPSAERAVRAVGALYRYHLLKNRE